MVDHSDRRVAHAIYRPAVLSGSSAPNRHRIEGIHFWNVSFSKTIVRYIEFKDCNFEQCLFIGTQFDDCRFTDCIFLDNNTHRVEFIDCYIDPASFEFCILNLEHSNIGVHLFQEILRNSRQQSQPEF
ncbi:MAG: hypothetical protein EOP09_12120, partial [Proteobacteria bacterium]